MFPSQLVQASGGRVGPTGVATGGGEGVTGLGVGVGVAVGVAVAVASMIGTLGGVGLGVGMLSLPHADATINTAAAHASSRDCIYETLAYSCAYGQLAYGVQRKRLPTFVPAMCCERPKNSGMIQTCSEASLFSCCHLTA